LAGAPADTETLVVDVGPAIAEQEAPCENGDAASVDGETLSMTAQKADLWTLGKKGDAASVDALVRAVEPQTTARNVDLVRPCLAVKELAGAVEVRTEAVIVLGEVMKDVQSAYRKRGTTVLIHKATDKKEDHHPRVAAINALRDIAQAADTPALGAKTALGSIAADKDEVRAALDPEAFYAAIQAALDPEAK